MDKRQESDEHQHHLLPEGGGEERSPGMPTHPPPTEGRVPRLVYLPFPLRHKGAPKEAPSVILHSARWNRVGEGSYARFSDEQTEALRALNDLLKVTREHTAPEYQVRLVQCHNPGVLLGL